MAIFLPRRPARLHAIHHLLSPELRPALRIWYQLHRSGQNAAALEFRDRLSKPSGENLG